MFISEARHELLLFGLAQLGEHLSFIGSLEGSQKLDGLVPVLPIYMLSQYLDEIRSLYLHWSHPPLSSALLAFTQVTALAFEEIHTSDQWT